MTPTMCPPRVCPTPPVHIINISGNIQNPTHKPYILLFLLIRGSQWRRPWFPQGYEIYISKIDDMFSMGLSIHSYFLIFISLWTLCCWCSLEWVPTTYFCGEVKKYLSRFFVSIATAQYVTWYIFLFHSLWSASLCQNLLASCWFYCLYM